MPVSLLLKNMSQKELVQWIAYFRLENEEHGHNDAVPPEKEKPQPEKVTAKISVKQPSQKQKDDLLLQQMFALVQTAKKKRRDSEAMPSTDSREHH